MPKFTILWGHVEEILLLNKFFPIVHTCLNDALKPATPLIAPLVSGVAGLSASSSSKQDTLNFDVKTAGCDSYFRQLECGPMPNVMVALPNIGGALCSTPQSLADAHY